MTNLSDTRINTTAVVGLSSQMILRYSLLGMILPCFILFFYFLALMLRVYFTSATARHQVRYVLFAHMLITDFIYLLFSLFLFLVSYTPLTFPAVFCYSVITVTSSTLVITPYSLAAMSLERYVAICLPLRHGELCTLRGANVSIAIVWTVGLLPRAADVIVVMLSSGKTIFSQNVACMEPSFAVTPGQSVLRVVTYASTFSSVGLIITFTYIKITLVAFRVDSGKSSASKAGRTVALHAFQLLLCMTAFTYSISEILFKDVVILYPVINFCFFMCFPRFLSPFIYGMRDELFRRHIKKFYPRNPSPMQDITK